MWLHTGRGLGQGGTAVLASAIGAPVAVFSPPVFRLRLRHSASPSRWFTLALLLALLLTAVPSLARRADFALPLTQDAPATMPITDAAPITNAAPVTSAPVSLPPGLGPVLRAALTPDNAAEYAPVAVAVAVMASEEVRAANPAQQFVTTFGANGVRVAPSGGSGGSGRSGGSAFSLRATDIATTGGSVALVATVPVIAGARVEYRRGNVTEWYENGPLGLEQGFTLTAPPAGDETAFTLRLAGSSDSGNGDAPVMDGDAIRVGGLRYGGLAVTDATGATLPAHLALVNGAIEIAVDATGATWPVTVDPTITTTVLAGDDHLRFDYFGQSVATTTLNGTTYIVVGAPVKTVGGNAYQGEAYVFSGSAGTYIQRARLTASDGAAFSEFGGSVAITPSADGTTVTIVVGACEISYCANKAYVFMGSGTLYPQQTILSLASDTPDSRASGFGRSVAVAITTGGKTTVAVGAPASPYLFGSTQYPGQGAVYFFEGTGSSYTFLADFVDAGGNPTNAVGIGASIAFVSNNGTNTLAVGAPSVQVSGVYQGGVFVLTGSGTAYTSVLLTASDGVGGDHFSQSVALALAHGVNTVVVGAPSKTVTGRNGGTGVVYVLTGSGTSYATTRLDNGDANADNGAFGTSVAVGFAAGNTLIAAGVPTYTPPGGASPPGQGEVALFTLNGATHTQLPSLPAPVPTSNGNDGTSVALTTAVNGDVTVIGGELYGTASGSTNTTYQSGTANVSYWRTTPAVVNIQAVIGDHANTIASSTQTSFDGTGIPLVAKVFAPGYGSVVPVGVTFTFDFAGPAHGVFDRNNPGLTSVHVMTYSKTDLSIDGNTPKVPIYPSGTAGTFNVTATVDGLPLLTTTFHLTILSSVPAPVLGRVINGHRVPDFSSVYINVSPPTDPYIVVSGSGFTLLSTVYLDCANPLSPPTQPQRTGFANENTLSVYLDHTLLTTSGSRELCVVNPPSHANGTDGGRSSPASEIILLSPMPAPPMSSAAPVGATKQYLAPGVGAKLVTKVVKSDGTPPLQPPTGGIPLLASAGSLITNDGGGIIAQGGGNIIAQGGGNIAAQGGGNAAVQTNETSMTQTGTTLPMSRAVAPRILPDLPYAGDYTDITNANGLFLSPPITSNGIPGTYTRAVSIDGVSAPVTFTITNLDPNDGHPATITGLSRVTIPVNAADFTLTVTGTGFIPTSMPSFGSVLSFGGVQLVTTFVSGTQVSATVPAALLKSAAVLDVVVINPDSQPGTTADGGASLPSLFTVTGPPTLTTLTLPAGSTAGGATVTLTGTNFAAGTTVSFGNVAATNVTVVNGTTLTAITPAHGAGVVDVSVVSSGVTVTLPQAYTYATIAPQPIRAPAGTPKPGGVSVQPGTQPPGAPLGAGTPAPMLQPLRH